MNQAVAPTLPEGISFLVPVEVTAAAEQQIEGVDERAFALEVVDQDTYDRAGTLLSGVRAARRGVVDFFKPYKEEAHQKHAAICAAEKLFTGRCDAADAHLVAQTDAYEAAEKAKRDAEEAERLQREATEKAAREAKLLEVAEMAEKSGDTAGAEAVLEAATAPRLPAFGPRPAAAPTLAGFTTQKTYEAQVTDLMALARAVVEGKVSIEYLAADQVALNLKARRQKRPGDLVGFPGVTVIEKKSKKEKGGGRGAFGVEAGM